MKFITEDAVINNAAIILEVDDKDIDYISCNKDYHKDKNYLSELMYKSGNNAFIVFVGCYEDVSILRGIEMILCKYDSICWWNRDHSKFFIKRRRLCHR